MIISLDYETYYSVEYSLSKLSTEAYIRHHQFEVIGASLAIGNGPPIWYPQPHLPAALAAIDWTTSSLLCWNTAFDGAILGWHYGIYPALYLDAMGMARACGRGYKGASLSAVAELLGIGAKGGYVAEAKGKRYADFTPAQLKDYGDYCSNDVALTREIYKRLAPEFVRSETLVQDRMLRMFIEPTLSFDSDALTVYHDDVVAQKRQALLRLAQVIGIEHQGESLPVPDNSDMLDTYDILADGKIKKTLMSNPKFAALLTSLGVDPPMKISPTTGLMTYAFAKSDEDFVELQEHEDPTVAAAVTARLGTKSTIEETRSKQFIDIAQRGLWPVQYNYWAAISSRFSGGGNANPQNLKRGGKLRDAVLPPPGHWLIAPDLSQIEARMVNYVAGQVDVIETFRAYDAGTGPDVYCVFAGRIYRRVITPDDKTERTIGKVGELSCIAEGQLVLTEAGLLPIEQVTSKLRVWDGEAWVQHDGPIYRGVRDVIQYQGLTATEDHLVWTGDGNVATFGSCAAQQIPLATTGLGRCEVRLGGGARFRSASNQHVPDAAHPVQWVRQDSLAVNGQPDGRENSRLPSMFAAKAGTRLVIHALKRGMSAMYQPIQSTVERLRRAWDSLQLRFHPHGGVVDTRKSRTTPRHGVGSQGQQRPLRTRESPLGHRTGEQAEHASRSHRPGVPPVQAAAPRGTVRRQHTETPAAYRLKLPADHRPVERPFVQTQRRVWDLLNCGPNHRFTVSGRLVHNCGYGASGKAYRKMLFAQAGQHITLPEAQKVVDIYRSTHQHVEALWFQADKALDALVRGVTFTLGKHGVLDGSRPDLGIGLPNGMYIKLPGLRKDMDGKGRVHYYYRHRKKEFEIYGAMLVAICIQALARLVLTEAMLRVSQRYRVVLQTHDELVVPVVIADVEDAKVWIRQQMVMPLDWAPGLPLACTVGAGPTYGGAH